MTSVIKSTQEQAIASWVDYLNQVRLDELIIQLKNQDTNKANALRELQKIKEFLNNPENILGSDKTKHGEIAEHMQVRIANARKLIDGLKVEYTFDGVGRLSPEDYMHNNHAVQSKFYSGAVGKQTFNAIKEHLKKYPDFINNGGEYEIPKDQYEAILELLQKPTSQLTRAEYNLVKAIYEWEKLVGVKFIDKVKPSVITYANAQSGQAKKTVKEEEKNINKRDKENRDEAYQKSKPSLKEAGKASLISGAVEGGVSFCLGVKKKIQSGKSINEFDSDDWKDIGIETGKGSAKGTIRGGVIYGMTNFTATPAAVASSLVTATLGVTSLTYQLQQEKITEEEFLEESQVLTLDVTISAVSSLLGHVMIPIPILGAVIGNVSGMFLYGIAKNNLSEREQKLIKQWNADIEKLNKNLEVKYGSITNFVG